MHGHIAHFAINADDLPATARALRSVFGWSFDGVPIPGSSVHVAGEAIAASRPVARCFRCRRTASSARSRSTTWTPRSRRREGGGSVLMPRATIPGVGDLAFLTDPSGNLVGVIGFSTPVA